MYSITQKDVILLFYLAFASLPLVLIAFIFRKRISKLGISMVVAVENNRNIKMILIFLIACFALFAYLSKPVYYSVYASGTIGDSLSFADMALERNNYIFPKHISHPLIAQQIIRFFLKAKFLSADDLNFKEKVFILSSLPMRLFASIGILFMLLLFRRILRFPFLKSFLAASFLGVSFAYWCWAITPNALAIGIVFELVTIFLVLKAIKSNQWVYFFLSAIFTALCCFAHIATGYFCLATAIFLAVFFILQFFYYNKFAFWNFFTYYSIIFFSGLFFYLISLGIFNLWEYDIAFGDFGRFIEILSDYRMFGPFSLPSFSQIFGMIKENSITGIVNIFGIWLPTSLIEMTIISLTISCIITLAIVFLVKFKECLGLFSRETVFFSVLFLIILAGFILRNGGTHYYSIALPVNLCLFLSVMFSSSRESLWSNFSIPVLITLILCTFAYNGFSSKTVYAGINIQDNIVYSNYYELGKMTNGKEVYFFEPLDIDRFCNEANFRPITDYYENKFSNINWITDFDENDIYNLMQNNKEAIFFAGGASFNTFSKKTNKLIFSFLKSSQSEDFYELKHIKD